MNMRRPVATVLSMVIALTLVLSVGVSTAEAKKPSARGQNRIKVDDFSSSGSSVDLGVAEIEGRIFKPAVFFVLARSDFQYKAIKFKQSFVDRIVKGALRRPF
ncbi:MAG: hypothetical protein KC502_21925 [Myxococcales bacterium]|nr:hypothetical protein [Myxococcales bacterium]